LVSELSNAAVTNQFNTGPLKTRQISECYKGRPFESGDSLCFVSKTDQFSCHHLKTGPLFEWLAILFIPLNNPGKLSGFLVV
jgi:hypothetical protein